MKRPSKSDRERIKHTRNDASGIDKLNPNLRSIENFNGQKRVREFYAMSPEDAYSILAAIAEIHGCEDKLTLVPLSKEQVEAENTAEDIQEAFQPYYQETYLTQAICRRQSRMRFS